MKRRNLLFLIGDNPALFLRSDADFDEGSADILLHDKCAVFPRGHNRSLIQQILEIRPGKSRGRLRDLF